MKASFGIPKKDGTLELRYDKIYSLNHIGIFLINKLGWKVNEKRVVYFVWGFEIIIILIGLIVFKFGIVT